MRLTTRTCNLLLMLIMAGCLSPFEFRMEGTPGRYIVSGQVSTVSHRNYVQVGQTAGTGRLPYTVSDADVVVSDGTNEWIFKENGHKTGRYTSDNFIGVPGHTYHVIVTDPATRKTFKSTPEKLPYHLATDSVFIDVTTGGYIDNRGTVSEQKLVNVRSKVKMPAQPDRFYLKWLVEGAYVVMPTDFPDPFGSVPPPCFVSESTDPQRITLLTNIGITGGIDETYLIAVRLADFALHTRYVLFVYQSSMTAEAYEYWRKVSIVVNQVGSIFDAPAGEIYGNIKNVNNADEIVYGYFQANNEAYLRRDIMPNDLPFKTVPLCNYNPQSQAGYPSSCLNCLDLPNSSHQPPPLFN